MPGPVLTPQADFWPSAHSRAKPDAAESIAGSEAQPYSPPEGSGTREQPGTAGNQGASPLRVARPSTRRVPSLADQPGRIWGAKCRCRVRALLPTWLQTQTPSKPGLLPPLRSAVPASGPGSGTQFPRGSTPAVGSHQQETHLQPGALLSPTLTRDSGGSSESLTGIQTGPANCPQLAHPLAGGSTEGHLAPPGALGAAPSARGRATF